MNWFSKKIAQLLSFRNKKRIPQFIETVQDDMEDQLPWWGMHVIDEEHSRFFKIGEIVLCFDRYNQEWHITSYREGQQPFKTFAAQASNEIILKPTLPDRALLTLLERPFYIPAGESLLLYVSSPLWIRIDAGSPPILLDEVPTGTLADTWFGKNTLEGELCYAGEAHCSPRLDELLRDVTRVVSPILYLNNSRETLVLHSLKVPLPELSIYCDKQNFLWTEQINVSEENDAQPEITVVKGSPKALTDAALISPARINSKSSFKDLLKWK